jgi:hypothetical protein
MKVAQEREGDSWRLLSRGPLQQHFELVALSYASRDHECNIVTLLAPAELTDGFDDGIFELLNREP